MGFSGEIADNYRGDGWRARVYVDEVCGKTDEDYRGDEGRARVKGHFVSGKTADDYGSDGWRARGEGDGVSGKKVVDILFYRSGVIWGRMGVSGIQLTTERGKMSGLVW
jgi:hypothetical protein